MTARTARVGIGRYLVHLAIAWPGIEGAITVGYVAFGLVLEAFGRTAPTPLGWLVAEPYFPLGVGLALFLGYGINRNRRSLIPCWVWIPPLIMLVWDIHELLISRAYIWDRTTPWRDVWNSYFGANCQGDECLGELLFTAPFYTSVLYSLGAWIALRQPKILVAGQPGFISRVVS